MKPNIKQCTECGSPLIIDEWDRWHWKCMHCEYDGGPATKKECDGELQWYIKADKEASEVNRIHEKEKEKKSEA